MRLTAVTFWSMFLAVLAINLGAGTDVISHHQIVNDVVVALSTIALAGLALNQIFPAPLAALGARIRTAPFIGLRDPLLPLQDAARELYEANVGTILGRAARMDPGDGADPLAWCAQWIVPRVPEIYGRRPPSTKLELVPPHLFTYARIEEHGRRLTGGDEGDFVDLAVKRRAFRAMIPALSDMSQPFGPWS